jgi:hypothetical protein
MTPDSDGGPLHGENVERADPTDSPTARRDPRLLSRILVTWIELTAVGVTGGVIGNTVGGPPGFVVYLATTLISIGIIFYNVNELIERHLARATSEGD